MENTQIVRMWTGWVRPEDRTAYTAYVEQTGIAAYRATPGNLDAWLLARDTGDGRVEITTLSRWESMTAVRAFAGDDPEQAVFYADDDRYLVDRETRVRHFELAAS
jgi:heme-degrading monooxygenase HmoA